MTKIIYYVALMAMFVGTQASAGQTYDFDSLNGNSAATGYTQKLDGSKAAADTSLERQQKKWEEEAEAERRAAEAYAARYREERTLGNGNRYYDCEYSCRTDGFLIYDGTDKFKQRVRADEEYDAKKQVKDQADQRCSQIKGEHGVLSSGNMWETGLRCSEVR